jgi:predicted transcriptional regulator
MARRALGALEAEILAVLSKASEPVSPGALVEALESEVSYSTVTTILARLVQKGYVTRTRHGRRYDYELTIAEADVAAGQMYERLQRSGDRVGVLRQFVGELDTDEAAALRALLEQLDADR